MKLTSLNEEQVEALWHKARDSGMPRRRFLILLASSGAAAVLAACTPAATPTPAPTPTPTPTPAPSPSPAPPAQLIYEPIPPQFFVPLGSNAEMRFELMANRTYQMPDSFFFVRSHSWTPQPPIDLKTWTLSIEGDGVGSPLKLTYDDLLAMPATTLTRYVECAGNGRSFYTSMMNKPAQGGQWHLGAYGIADWTGVKLSDILKRPESRATPWM